MNENSENGVYNFFKPHEELQGYIAYYSIYKGKFLEKSPVFLPDLGGSIIISQCNDNIINVWGPYSKTTRINTFLNGLSSQFLIEFQPGGLSFLIYQNCTDLLNMQLLLEDVNKGFALKIKNIFEQYKNTGQIIAALDTLFLNILNTKESNMGQKILKYLQNVKTTMPIYDFTEKIGYTTRHINRYLNTVLGVSGKKYLKIKRFYQSVELLKSHMKIEEIAFALEYFDPSHFIHEFMTISGLSPLNFRQNMSDFYNYRMKIL